MWRLLIPVIIAALAYAQWPPAGMRCPQRTLVLSELGQNATNAAQFAAEHFDYMRALMKSGKVISAGPMEDEHTAAILFTTKEWSEAEQMLAKEPFHRERVLKIVSHSVWTACEAEEPRRTSPRGEP